MNTAAQYVIGVDIGTQSTKAVLVSAEGRIVAQASQAYQVETPKPLWAQQWPDVWLDAVEASICGVLADAHVDAASVRALCISSLTVAAAFRWMQTARRSTPA